MVKKIENEMGKTGTETNSLRQVKKESETFLNKIHQG